MKTKEQIESEGFCEKCGGEVYTLEEFIDCVRSKLLIPYDGDGYFHDGTNETDINVWRIKLSITELVKYPYVCWYNK